MNAGDHYFKIDPHKPGASGFHKFDTETNLEIPTGNKFAQAHQKFLDATAAAAKKKALALRKKIR